MNVNNATPIMPAVQQPVLNQEAKACAQNAFPKPPEVAQPAPRSEAPDQSKQKANLEASGWRASQHAIAAKGRDGLDNYTDAPNQRLEQASAAYKAIEKQEQRASVDAIV
ncbi:MAG: hypothetical protein HOH02_11590 [Oceanospirillaceae bacterium]|jgi:hypothetical protein|nr:hypothetical protein [Oceanospirillaceae bacterium]MBT4442701.1 hypothetical protein [Oceanospirillaceae bacterium]MBT6078586.1 hypothetical protein [Oceanospirillaceae bacterium]MBT7331418.1 hypothetical protein [Oceanospirillaceae bacterium]